MENASKALIMAGGILIAILIISLGIGLSSMMQENSKSYYKTLSTQEIAKINSEITKDFVQPFKDDTSGNQYITAQGIVTLKNLKEKLKEQGIELELSGTFIGGEDLEILRDKSIAQSGLLAGKTCYYTVEIKEYENNIIKKIEIGTTSYKKDTDGTREI